MRSMRSRGRNTGVSLSRNLVGTPQRCSTSWRKRSYFSGRNASLNCRRREGIKQELSSAHDLGAVDPDVEFAPDDIDVRAAVPVGTGVRAVRISEGDVDAGDLLVLQNIPDHVAHADVGTDGELAHAIAVLVGMTVVPELLFEHLVAAVRFDEAAVADDDSQRRLAKIAIALAQIVADHAIDHEGAIDALGCGEGLTSRKIAPFVR